MIGNYSFFRGAVHKYGGIGVMVNDLQNNGHAQQRGH